MRKPNPHRVEVVCIIAMILTIAGLSLAFIVDAAYGHEGDHPVHCDEVEVPHGADCYDPNTDENLSQWHAVCVLPGEGSAIGRPVECLPETGSENTMLTIIAGMLIAAGATMLLLTGIKKANE